MYAHMKEVRPVGPSLYGDQPELLQLNQRPPFCRAVHTLNRTIGQCKGCPTPLPVLIEHVQRDPIGGDVAGLREPLDPQRVSELSG